MTNLRRRSSHKRFFGHDRKRAVKYITVLPSLVTIINGACGFVSLVLASSADAIQPSYTSHFAMAGYMILLAMFADMLDGRLARMSQSTSSFGGQLDSLCDVISFGVAPGFLMLKLLQYQLKGIALVNTNILQRFIWLATLAYITCAAIRLARFNVENEQRPADHTTFTGLPSPAAAGVLISMIIFHQEMTPQSNFIVYILPAITFCTAALMISRIPYPHIFNLYLRGKKPFGYLIRILIMLGMVWVNLQAALVLLFYCFAASGIIKTIHRRYTHPVIPVPVDAEVTLPEATE